MKNLTKITLILAFILVFGMLALTSFAQDNSETLPEDPPTELVIVDGSYVKPDEIANGLESFLNEQMSVPSLAALVLVLTAASKYIMPSSIPSKSISFFWVIVTYGAYALAANWGYTVQLENVADLITKLGGVLLGATGTAVVSHYGYQVTKSAGVPLIGTSRKPPDA